jgi:uncharacterized membrane protein YoaK (UPF0700 family)
VLFTGRKRLEISFRATRSHKVFLEIGFSLSLSCAEHSRILVNQLPVTLGSKIRNLYTCLPSIQQPHASSQASSLPRHVILPFLTLYNTFISSSTIYISPDNKPKAFNFASWYQVVASYIMASPIPPPKEAHFDTRFSNEHSSHFLSQDATPIPTRPSSPKPSNPNGLKDEVPLDLQAVNLRAMESARSQQHPRTPNPFKQFKHHMKEEVNLEYSWIIIMCCFFSSGIIDAVSYNSWSVFVEIQIGNTIFAGLGLSHQPESGSPKGWTKALTSIAGFCIGPVVFDHFHMHGGVRRRAVMLVSFFVQFLYILTATVLTTICTVSGRPGAKGEFSSGAWHDQAMMDCIDRTPLNWADLATVAILAFQASDQVYLSRALGYNDLPTIVLTILYCDFRSNLHGIYRAWATRQTAKDFFFVKGKKQMRRVIAIVLLFSGAVIGGLARKSPHGSGMALWVAVAVKLGILVAWFCWKKKEPSIV